MKKTIVLGIFIIFIFGIISFAIVNAESNSESGRGIIDAKSREQIREEVKSKIQEDMNKEKKELKERMESRGEKMEEMQKKMIELREKIRQNKGEFKIENENIVISELNEEKREIIAGRINAKTGLNLMADDINGSTGSILRAYLSNGRFANIKIMPDKASEIALKKLRAKCIERNCSVELKEVSFNNQSRAAWVVETNKDSRVFLIFKKKMIVRAEVDPETGEIIRLNKPWWAFFAKEKNADESEIEEEITENQTEKNNKVFVCHMPRGNPENRHTIKIGESALRAHLAHGDSLGECLGQGNQTNPGNQTNTTNTTYMPPTVTNLTAINITNSSIDWKWINPSDLNFSKAIVIFNGINVENTTNNYYNATSLNANETYTINVHTLGINGAVNKTDVNDTEITLV